MSTTAMTQFERRAFERVRRAGVRAPDSAVLGWIRSVGPNLILATTLHGIRLVANAF
jgi:hypothetical protein